MKTTKMTPTAIENINNDIKKALSAIEDKYGINIGFGNISYSDLDFATKMTVSVVGEICEAERLASNRAINKILGREEFKGNESVIGSTLFSELADNSEFTVVKYNINNRKNKWTISVNGQEFLCPNEVMQKAIIIKKA